MNILICIFVSVVYFGSLILSYEKSDDRNNGSDKGGNSGYDSSGLANAMLPLVRFIALAIFIICLRVL